MTTNYRERVKLPPFCTPEDERLEFRTRSGLVLAHGYVRLEFGGRGPFIEFAPAQIVREAIHHIDDPSHRYFDEYRSSDESNVMIYRQRRPVGYAVYNRDMWYISPFDLATNKYPELVAPISSGVPLLPGLEMYG